MSRWSASIEEIIAISGSRKRNDLSNSSASTTNISASFEYIRFEL